MTLSRYEAMTVANAKRIVGAVNEIVDAVVKTSKDDAELAVAQLLLTAAILARSSADMSTSEFDDAANIAMSNCLTVEKAMEKVNEHQPNKSRSAGQGTKGRPARDH